MTIHKLLERARRGEYDPVQVLVGAERFLVERAIQRLRDAVVGDGPRGFNEETFDVKSTNPARICETARTLPMMAKARLVLARGLEGLDAAKLEPFTKYLAEPSPSTCLVLTGDKILGTLRFSKQAKKRGYWYDAAPLRASDLPRFAQAEAGSRGKELTREAAAALVDATGNDLAAIDDAMERLSLYVGEATRIEAGAVRACVAHLRVESIWTLVDAVSQRNAPTALRCVASLLADREPALRILALLARQFRIVARMQSALAAGVAPPQAAQRAGAPPFKARELAQASRRFGTSDLTQAFAVLAATDVTLKSSRQPPDAVLERAVLRLCAIGQPAR